MTHCIPSSRGLAAALLTLAACSLLAGCATDSHWRMEHAQPSAPSVWRLSSSSFTEPASPATPWWEHYRPLIPREQDTCALLQQSAQVDESLRLATNRPLSSQQALALWSWLARAPLTLPTFAPRTALSWLLRNALAQGRPLPTSEFRPLCERLLALAVLRPDGYLAAASTGQPSQRMGEVALRDGAFVAGNFVVGRLYLSRGGVFYPLDEELRLSSSIPVGELGLEKDLVNTALDGAEEAFAETALALAVSLMDVEGTLEGLRRLPTTVGTLIESSPEYLARYRDRPLREQVREAALDPAYHQLITNEFRRLAGYGNRPPRLNVVLEIMKKVYAKYPLPGVHF